MGWRRVEGLVFERVNGELLVYSPKTSESHALNEPAAIVFEHCEEPDSRGTMAAEIARCCGLPSDEAIVDLALADLTEAGLVQADDGAAPPAVTRRALVRRLALTVIAAAALPVVETVIMPTVAAAAPVKLPVVA
jgi:hypothetical protein